MRELICIKVSTSSYSTPQTSPSIPQSERKMHKPCRAGYFACNTTDYCVHQRLNCDSNDDCGDNSDEQQQYCGKS